MVNISAGCYTVKMWICFDCCEYYKQMAIGIRMPEYMPLADHKKMRSVGPFHLLELVLQVLFCHLTLLAEPALIISTVSLVADVAEWSNS